MEATLFIVVIYIIFKFNGPLTILVKTIFTAFHIADDTVDTYANDVHIMNADKRAKQKTELDAMETIVTTEDINRILSGKQPVKTPE